MIASTASEWTAAAAGLFGPFIGVFGAVWLYTRQRRDSDSTQRATALASLFLQLRAELEANRRIVTEALHTIDHVLNQVPADDDPNEPIFDETLYIAPLFAQSWAALARTDAHRELPESLIDDLFVYYTTVARANWLIERVQTFKFRRPILVQIRSTLAAVQDPKVDLSQQLGTLQRYLAPGTIERMPGTRARSI